MKTPFIRRCSLLGLGLALLFAGALPLAAGDDPAKKADPPKPEEKKKVGYGVPGTDTVPVMPPEWKTVAKERLSPGQLDALLQKEQKADQLKPSPLTTDEQFIRRGDDFFRRNEIWRRVIDRRTGDTTAEELVKRNCARVVYELADDVVVIDADLLGSAAGVPTVAH